MRKKVEGKRYSMILKWIITMNNPNQQQSPALRMEAVSINCILVYASLFTATRNLLILAESTFDRLSDHLTAHYGEYILLMRIMLLIHLIGMV